MSKTIKPEALRILIVDDSETTRRIVGTILRSRHWTICGEAENGRAGVEKFQKLKPDIVLLDLSMPDMTGIEILRQVKQSKYLKCAPVVVLTTTDDSHEIKRCYELGCNVYITKPVNYESFANAIRQLGLFFSVIQVPTAAT